MTDISSPTGSKICNECHVEKPLAEFDRDSSIATGYRGRCKPCRRRGEAARRDRVRTREQKQRDAERQAAEEARRAQEAAAAEQRERQASYRQAIMRLINNHRTEFERLVYSEQVQRGIVEPQGRFDDDPDWMIA